MSRKWSGKLLASGAALVLLLASHGGAWGQFEGVSCGGSCGRAPCPPKFHHHFEGQPKLKYKRACPKPVCNPCDLENWGYYQTCWRPWPWAPNWNHCPVVPPGAL